MLNNTSDSEEYYSGPDNISNSTGTSTLFEPFVKGINGINIIVPSPKRNNYWCMPRELYNR